MGFPAPYQGDFERKCVCLKYLSNSRYLSIIIGMVNWKVVLVVIIIAALAVSIGMWFGYRYVSEQEDITPEGWRNPADAADESLVLAASSVKVLQGQCCLL